MAVMDPNRPAVIQGSGPIPGYVQVSAPSSQMQEVTQVDVDYVINVMKVLKPGQAIPPDLATFVAGCKPLRAILNDDSLNISQKRKKFGKVLSSMRVDHKKHRELIVAEIDRLKQENAEIDKQERWIQATIKVCEWYKLPPVLEKNDCSRFHKLSAALDSGDAYIVKAEKEGAYPLKWDHKLEGNTRWELAWKHDVTPFVVQHDWAKAFEGATDFDEGDFKLPYEYCVFEFRITGRNVVAFVMQLEDQPVSDIDWLVEVDGMWLNVARELSAKAPQLELIRQQIKAISVALDAEAATHTVVRAPSRLNAKRIKDGKRPLSDYNIVQLSRRTRIANPLESGGGGAGGVGTKRRLHFRRGHWRHFQDGHKTWIKWMLVGDPDLGFVDKEYRL